MVDMTLKSLNQSINKTLFSCNDLQDKFYNPINICLSKHTNDCCHHFTYLYIRCLVKKFKGYKTEVNNYFLFHQNDLYNEYDL